MYLCLYISRHGGVYCASYDLRFLFGSRSNLRLYTNATWDISLGYVFDFSNIGIFRLYNNYSKAAYMWFSCEIERYDNNVVRRSGTGKYDFAVRSARSLSSYCRFFIGMLLFAWQVKTREKIVFVENSSLALFCRIINETWNFGNNLLPFWKIDFLLNIEKFLRTHVLLIPCPLSIFQYSVSHMWFLICRPLIDGETITLSTYYT